MSNLSARQEFKERVIALKSQGLKDIKFYPGEVSNALPESFCVEAINLLDVVANDAGDKLVFGDSQTN